MWICYVFVVVYLLDIALCVFVCVASLLLILVVCLLWLYFVLEFGDLWVRVVGVGLLCLCGFIVF